MSNSNFQAAQRALFEKRIKKWIDNTIPNEYPLSETFKNHPCSDEIEIHFSAKTLLKGEPFRFCFSGTTFNSKIHLNLHFEKYINPTRFVTFSTQIKKIEDITFSDIHKYCDDLDAFVAMVKPLTHE